MTFLLFPDVVIPIAISPAFPIALICLENKNSKPKSFPIALNVEVSVTKEITE